jgi:hypothetical protein
MVGFNSEREQEQRALAQSIDEFGKAQEALIARLENKIEQQEQMLAAMVVGYVELAAMTEALIEERLLQDNVEEFGELLAEKKRKILESIQLGQMNAEDKFNRFTPHNQGATGL